MVVHQELFLPTHVHILRFIQFRVIELVTVESLGVAREGRELGPVLVVHLFISFPLTREERELRTDDLALKESSHDRVLVREVMDLEIAVESGVVQINVLQHYFHIVAVPFALLVTLEFAPTIEESAWVTK